MFFKPQSLIRPGLWKSATQGYAQSLVAGYQSSTATQNNPIHNLNNNVVNYFHKSGHPYHSQNALPTHRNSPATGIGLCHDVSCNDKGLDEYYAAWQKHQRPGEGEWHQTPFGKRAGWKAPTTILEVQLKPKDSTKPVKAQQAVRKTLVRSQSTGDLDGIRQSDKELQIETEAARQDGDVIAEEINRVTTEALAAASYSSEAPIDGQVPPAASSDLGTSTSSFSPESTARSQTTEATSASDTDSYTENLTKLAENHQYAEIPAVFESMLISGITPTATAYNALLLAAINLPRSNHQIVLKVLDVCSDMNRRGVKPETSTCAIVLELLAKRALHVMSTMRDMQQTRIRYGNLEQESPFLFQSDEAEFKILAEDDSLSLAVRLFDTSAAVAADHVFQSDTYQLLISACAEAGRIGDMVRIYAEMESHGLRPTSSMFAPMIHAFANAGDLRSAVECYDEYKALAVAHDSGEISIVRKDEDVYAAVVKAYAICGRLSGGLKFLGKIEDTLDGSPLLTEIRDAVGLKALQPEWLQSNLHSKALEHATTSLSAQARDAALATICTDAADKNKVDIVSQTLDNLSLDGMHSTKPLIAVLAMHLRNAELSAAVLAWNRLESRPVSYDLVEPTVMYTIALIQNGQSELALRQSRQIFSRIRESNTSSQESRLLAIERVNEAVDLVTKSALQQTVAPTVTTAMELLWMMTENNGLNVPLAERLLASLGPDEVATLTWSDLNLLAQIQSGMFSTHVVQDVAHVARFAHLLDLIASSGAIPEKRTEKMIGQALAKLDRPDLNARWQNRRLSESIMSPVHLPSVFQTQATAAPSVYEDMYDPYGSSTDFKGSAVIAEELEKTYGRHASHLNEALTRFRNMRRTGRHPRYVTYAKLIAAAAKENRINLAQEILAMAKQDVPLVSNSRVVRHGWISILDSMVSACLTIGRRDLAATYHQELTSMGAAPSANTFGLYITTLKESTKTFDEATEAVKIFHRAKAEGVEASSFLYNALIGKLGKARRIDDCLFYFAEMRGLGIRPTSVTYGTIVNALCRVSDDKFAEELFEEMESMSNYKPRPAPYNSLMQYFLTTKRDRSKVLNYYQRMKANKIQPTMHTYKLLIDTHATLDPVDMDAAEAVLEEIREGGAAPEAVHYASLIHAKGCVLHDVAGARKVFDQVIAEGRIPPQASLYQALFEGMVANHEVEATEPLLEIMAKQRVSMTPYIANTLIHGWAMAKKVEKAREIFDSLGRDNREPSTYEAMTRAYLAVEDHGHAMGIVGEALRRGYPAAVANKICELVGGGSTRISAIM